MNNGGVYDLAAFGITTALGGAALTPIDDLDGLTAVTLEFAFAYGSGGTVGGFAKVQTSFDEGTTWRDIARVDIGTASFVKHCNLEGLLSKGITAYADLGAEGVYDGVLGDRLRAVVTTVGTYANTTLAIRASAR